MRSRRGGALGRLAHIWGRLLVAIAVAGCAASAQGHGAAPCPPAASVDAVSLTILQMNDVYELTPVAGGAQGGLARVAAVRRALLGKNPNTIAILAGDLFNPSALGRAVVDGERLSGRQIVDVMNAVGLDYATFGNHEFDLSEVDFKQRLSESKATWLSSNVSDVEGRPFPGVSASAIFTVKGAAGRTARVGLFGLTIGTNPAAYVRYVDPMVAARRQVEALRPQVDVLIAVTHLSVDQDVAIVQAFPEIDLVIGGHDHEDMLLLRGARLTPIAKADANARTVFVHEVLFDSAAKTVAVESRLVRITAGVREDPDVAARVQRWVDRAFAGFRAEGFEPTRVVARTTEPLDGTEVRVRSGSTRLTELLAQAMLDSVPRASWSIYNSGAIRIDDVLPPAPVTEYDVIRILPYGGTVVPVAMKGALLQRVLDQGRANKGQGGYLQAAHAGAGSIQAEETYMVAIGDFLLTGREMGLEFLKDNPDVQVQAGPRLDMRRVLIDGLARAYPLGTGR